MSLRTVLCMTVLLMVGITQTVYSQEAPNTSDGPVASDVSPEARMIIDRYIAATGGKEAWESLESLQGNGTVSIPAASISGSAEFCITSDLYRNTFRMNGGQVQNAVITSGRNGDVIWQITGEADQFKGKIVEGVERMRSLRQFQFNQLLDLDANFSRIDLVDVELVNEKPAFRLEMVPRENPASIESRYFDQDSYLIVRTVVKGEGAVQESFYGNYVDVGPVKMHTNTKRMAGDAVLMQVDMLNLQVNKPYPAKFKKMPYEIRVLLGTEKVAPPITKSPSDSK